jgi:hypothetical protein
LGVKTQKSGPLLVLADSHHHSSKGTPDDQAGNEIGHSHTKQGEIVKGNRAREAQSGKQAGFGYAGEAIRCTDEIPTVGRHKEELGECKGEDDKIDLPFLMRSVTRAISARRIVIAKEAEPGGQCFNSMPSISSRAVGKGMTAEIIPV